MRKIIKSQCNKLQMSYSDQQYLIFKPVGVEDLAKIDRARDSVGKHIRMAHYADSNLLIVKLMPSLEHEAAVVNLVKRLDRILALMGVPPDEFYGCGAARYSAGNSSKEGDSAYKPLSSRPNKTDWPTIVFESGVSEPLRRLRSDARWWLEHSGGDVNIVIIISIMPVQSKIHIERWELVSTPPTRPLTRAVPNANIQIPTKMQEIIITSNAVIGAPLVLAFDKIFLHPAVLPETDITFTRQELSSWAANFWQSVK